MIHLLLGDNEFTKRQQAAALLSGALPPRYDGEALGAARLRELLRGQTLFGGEAPVIISQLSDNAEAWALLPELAEQTDTTLILLETKPDKRTKTYKWLQKHATVSEHTQYTERQKPQLARWCVAQAKEHGAALSLPQATTLIDRLGYDQLRLDMVLQQLALAEAVTDELLDALVPLAAAESAFELLEAVIRRDRAAVKHIVRYLELTGGDDGAYQTVGLLTSQLTTLAGLVLGDNAATVATDLAVHPFVVKKLTPLTAQADRQRLRGIVAALAHADRQMKSTTVSPWLLLETALAKAMGC